MSKRMWQRARFLMAWLCIGQTFALAESKPLELKWEEVALIVANHQVELTLTDGVKISGEAIATREDRLVVDVKRSSDIKQYPAGTAAVPNSSIRLIKLQRTRGTWGRTMGTSVGAISGAALGGYAGVHVGSAGGAVAIFAAVASAAAIGGYLTGRGLDKRVTNIVLVP